MATTVVPAAATVTRFEDSFERAVLQSERLRVTIVITGIVNKFLGDGFMAVFGAPISDARDCQNAVAASLEIIQKVEAMSASGEIAPTRIRIGLHAGEAVAGNVGSTARKEYTIIGDVVNLAARLEQLNKQFGSRVLVSETSTERLDGLTERATPHGAIQVKGREQPVKVYELA